MTEPLQSTEFFRELFKRGIQIARTWNPTATIPAHIPHDMLLSRLFIESIPADKLKDVRIEFGQNLDGAMRVAVGKEIKGLYKLLINTCNVLANVELPELLTRVAQYNINKRRERFFEEVITFENAISREQTEDLFKKEFLPLTCGGTSQYTGSVVHVSLKKMLSLIEEVTKLKGEKLKMEEAREIIKKVTEDKSLAEAERLDRESENMRSYSDYDKVQWRNSNRKQILIDSGLNFTQEDEINKRECDKEINDLVHKFINNEKSLKKKMVFCRNILEKVSTVALGSM